MSIDYLKKASRTSTDDAGDVRATVQTILDEIEAGGDEAAMRYAAKFDKYDGNVVLTADEIEAAAAKVPQKLKDDIRFAWDNIRRFAEAQKATIVDTEIEVVPGLIAAESDLARVAIDELTESLIVRSAVTGSGSGDALVADTSIHRWLLYAVLGLLLLDPLLAWWFGGRSV